MLTRAKKDQGGGYDVRFGELGFFSGSGRQRTKVDRKWGREVEGMLWFSYSQGGRGESGWALNAAQKPKGWHGAAEPGARADAVGKTGDGTGLGSSRGDAGADRQPRRQTWGWRNRDGTARCVGDASWSASSALGVARAFWTG